MSVQILMRRTPSLFLSFSLSLSLWTKQSKRRNGKVGMRKKKMWIIEHREREREREREGEKERERDSDRHRMRKTERDRERKVKSAIDSLSLSLSLSLPLTHTLSSLSQKCSGVLRDVVANELDWDTVGSLEFGLQKRYNAHFWTNTLR